MFHPVRSWSPSAIADATGRCYTSTTSILPVHLPHRPPLLHSPQVQQLSVRTLASTSPITVLTTRQAGRGRSPVERQPVQQCKTRPVFVSTQQEPIPCHLLPPTRTEAVPLRRYLRLILCRL